MGKGKSGKSSKPANKAADSGGTSEYEGYCVKCREKRTFQGKVKTNEATGRRMAQGECPVCGTKVNRMLGKSD